MSRPPTRAPLSRVQVSTLRRALHAEQRRLLERASLPSTVTDASSREANLSDEATESLAQGEALAGSRQAQGLLAEVQAALARIEAGTYGTSELSGKPIGYDRLSALPWARLTAIEQDERDRVGRVEPAP